MEDRARPRSPADQSPPDADRGLLAQIRAGDVEAGHRFVRDHYAAIYRYLLHLTRQPDVAEDLTQETFLQGWRRLETFQGRGSLRSWLYRIAHREYLHLLQRPRAGPGWDTLEERAAPDAAARLDRVELRDVIDRLSLEQREVVLLYYLEGYSSTEIARITEVPVGTVCSRLARAREHLRRELGEDDLAYLNEPAAPMRQWAWLPMDQMHALETRLSQGGKAKEDMMERRAFLRQAAVGAAGLMLSDTEKEVVDDRLTQKVTCAFKGTAVVDLCEKLKTDTGIAVTAGPSVADEKVTLFCEKRPLREVMRQLSRPFGYTWLRSGAPGKYRYELVQDLRSQLLEEELRNRDRNAAFLALERDIEAFRPYLGLSPDHARERAKSAAPEEKKRLEVLAGLGWGQINLYFQLTAQQQAVLRAGQTLKFGQQPDAGEEPLPPEIALGVRESRRDLLGPAGPGAAGEAEREGGPPRSTGTAASDARARRIVDDPDAQAVLTLRLDQSELGRFTLDGTTGVRLAARAGTIMGSDGPYAEGSSPTVERPDNAVVNARLAHDPALQGRVTVKAVVSGQWIVDSDRSGSLLTTNHQPLTTERKLTSADVLEALHRATGLPIVADFYTRLYPPGSVTEKDQPLFEALNRVADAMHMRWNKEAGGWLQFRSTSYYDDRVKEVPNRLLARWAGTRLRVGALGLDDLIEIAGLTDAQLDADGMAEGARVCWGLEEWYLARGRAQRPHLRFLAQLTPAQRQEAQSAAGLAFTRLTLAQQQQFLPLALGPDFGRLGSIQEVAGAALRVELTRAGGFEWHAPEEPGRVTGGPDAPPPAQGPTPESALAAARRVDPRATAAQIVPSEPALTFQYLRGGGTAGPLAHVVRVTASGVAIQMGGPRSSGG